VGSGEEAGLLRPQTRGRQLSTARNNGSVTPRGATSRSAGRATLPPSGQGIHRENKTTLALRSKDQTRLHFKVVQTALITWRTVGSGGESSARRQSSATRPKSCAVRAISSAGSDGCAMGAYEMLSVRPGALQFGKPLGSFQLIQTSSPGCCHITAAQCLLFRLAQLEAEREI